MKRADMEGDGPVAAGGEPCEPWCGRGNSRGQGYRFCTPACREGFMRPDAAAPAVPTVAEDLETVLGIVGWTGGAEESVLVRLRAFAASLPGTVELLRDAAKACDEQKRAFHDDCSGDEPCSMVVMGARLRAEADRLSGAAPGAPGERR